MDAPTPDEVKEARTSSGMTQQQAAETIHVKWRAWQRYESGERSMHPAFFELFLLKTGKKRLT